MANEKVSSISLAISKLGQVFSITANAVEDLAGDEVLASVQSIGTSWEAINIGDCSAADVLAVKNADATNYVELALDNAGANLVAKLTAGRFAYIPVHPNSTIYARANTAACLLQVVVAEP